MVAAGPGVDVADAEGVGETSISGVGDAADSIGVGASIGAKITVGATVTMGRTAIVTRFASSGVHA